MEQLLQVRVILETLDSERLVSALSSLVQCVYGNTIVKNTITIDELIDTIVLYEKMVGFSKEISPQVHAVVDLYMDLQNYIANWKPAKASSVAVILEEALFSLNTSITSYIEGENYVKQSDDNW